MIGLHSPGPSVSLRKQNMIFLRLFLPSWLHSSVSKVRGEKSVWNTQVESCLFQVVWVWHFSVPRQVLQNSLQSNVELFKGEN